jgi:hypothetical protein
LAAPRNRDKVEYLTVCGGQVKEFPAVTKKAFGRNEFILNNLLNLR